MVFQNGCVKYNKNRLRNYMSNTSNNKCLVSIKLQLMKYTHRSASHAWDFLLWNSIPQEMPKTIYDVEEIILAVSYNKKSLLSNNFLIYMQTWWKWFLFSYIEPSWIRLLKLTLVCFHSFEIFQTSFLIIYLLVIQTGIVFHKTNAIKMNWWYIL